MNYTIEELEQALTVVKRMISTAPHDITSPIGSKKKQQAREMASWINNRIRELKTPPTYAHSILPQSKIAEEWLSCMEKRHGITIIREYRLLIGERYIAVDGFCPTTGTVYEFHGDYWHGNPAIYHTGFNESAGERYEVLYQRTLARERAIRNCGYKLITIWESEWKDKL